MKILCALGKYQYGDSNRGLSTEYAAFIPALKNLGHDVRHFELWDRSRYSSYAKLNQTLLEVVDRERPDVLLTVQLQYEIFIETLEMIKNRGDVATVCWTTDDSWKYREVSRFIGRHYHAMTTTYPDVISSYHRNGVSHILLTQWAARSDRLLPPLCARQCRYPVSFIGEAHGDRRQRIQYLLDQGIPVSCFGYGWPHGPVSADDVPEIMRNSVISLNFANSRGQRDQIKARTFEVPGAGGFLLTEAAPYLEDWYLPDQEVAVFRTDADLVQKIIFYLSHPDVRDRIAAAGFDRTCKEHTYEKRLSSVLRCALHAKADGEQNSDKPSAGPDLPKAVYLYDDSLPEPSGEERFIRMIRWVLVWGCRRIWGCDRGLRAARRIIFELSWRLAKEKTFSQFGWPSRMFPEL